MGGDLECPRGYNIKVGNNRVGGIGCVTGDPSALAMRGDWGLVIVFFLRGSLLIL